MTALRQELFDVVRILPEENISSALNYIRKNFLSPKKKDFSEMSTEEFMKIMAKKYGLKDNAAEIQASVNFITGALKDIDESAKKKSLKEWREERLKEKYAEYLD